MSRMMYDSDVIADLPRNSMAATYSDLIPDKAALTRLRAEFPHGLVLIDRHGDPTDAASVLDVERGLHTPNDIPAWLDAKKAQGITGTVYCDRANLKVCNAAAGKREHFRWIATLDGTIHIDGFVAGQTPAAVQFANSAMVGFHCDASVVNEDGWHPTPAIWQGSTVLLHGLQTVLTEVENCIMVVKQHR